MHEWHRAWIRTAATGGIVGLVVPVVLVVADYISVERLGWSSLFGPLFLLLWPFSIFGLALQGASTWEQVIGLGWMFGLNIVLYALVFAALRAGVMACGHRRG